MLVYPNSTRQFARREAGGKGYNLYLLSAQGLPVPDWVVLGARVWEHFVRTTGLEPVIAEALARFRDGSASAARTAAAIAERIEAAPLDEQVRSWLEQGLAALGHPPRIAVRSSAADEDSAGHSFAGQLASFLYVEGAEQAARCLKRCWASGFTERALVYRRERGLALEGIRVAVILQTMIDPDTSGVLFTCDAVAGTIDAFVVSAVYGVGEGLVSGALDADTYRLDAASGALLSAEIARKEQAFRRSAEGGCAAVPVPPELRERACLGEAELKQLHALGQQLLAYYRRPQDVEWAFAGGKLYLLQSRPVTTLERELTGYPNLWDNSNIIESYGGITLPLSFTFALDNYRNVYVQFCEVLKVPPAVIKDMDEYLRNMLGSIDGRVYYNLYNWYKLVGVLPGFRHNREFMETMMGVREALSGEIAERVRPHPSWDTLRGRLRRLRTGLAFLWYHFRIQAIVDRFLREFHEHYERYRHLEYERMTSDEIFQVYLELKRVMLSRWKAPIINDFLCMVHFGLLKRLTARWLGGLDPNLQNDLLAGEGNLESAEPTKELIRLAGLAAREPALRALIEQTPPADLLEALKQSPHRAFYEEVERYIDRFGFRCMNEMKLEEIDLREDPSYLFVCLKNYLRAGTTDRETYERREQQLRQRAEAQVRRALRGWRKWVYLWSLKHARKAVRNRENTRFARTRIYGVARTMFNAMGADLVGRGVLERPRDIFYLTLEEIYGIHQGTLTAYDLKDLVALRKRAYERFATRELRPRFLTRGPVYWQNRYLEEPEAPELEPDAEHDLKGLPCCPGVVEGVVKVVHDARDDLVLAGEILVTPRTDPGWVPLYPSVSGLLVERGSLLSHSAIVAREMGLPAIVSIRGLLRTLRSGMRVRMDGKAGTVKILAEGAGSPASTAAAAGGAAAAGAEQA
ncbi:MAG: phosphoenolpyruvate synthase [Planctomycetota bacterium]|nr:MAG: phosphoenolpyruvate synthase [Planctomycetota bacterium]